MPFSAPIPTAAAFCALALPSAFASSVQRPAEDLAGVLEPIRREHDVPALAAALVEDGAITAIGAVGLRRRDGEERVTADDRWRLGSCGKAMTATALARLVERGALRWDSTLAELFPERAEGMHGGFGAATVRQLLDHRAGLPEDVTTGGWGARLATGSAREQRLALLDELLARPPAYPAGTSYAYSNAGFLIAGAILERSTDLAFETVLQRELFTPLGMSSAGIGAPDASGEPWGHTANGRAVDPRSPLGAHPARYAPAGDVHASLADWARFAALHARVERGAALELRPETLATMHAPVAGASYACGFSVGATGWADGAVLAHHGTSAWSHACVWISPADDTALLVACNQGGDAAERACHAAAEALALELVGRRAPR